MTVLPGQQLESSPRPGLLPESYYVVSDAADWDVEFHEGVTGRLEGPDEAGSNGANISARLTLTGAGDVTLKPACPVSLAADLHAAHIWISLDTPFETGRSPELLLLFTDGSELSLGQLDFHGWHLLNRSLPQSPRTGLSGIVLRGIYCREDTLINIGGLGFDRGDGGSLDVSAPAESPYRMAPSMVPHTGEEVTTSIEKEGISFVFESRSLTAVVRYIYTPIEGNLSDVEVEINKAESIKLSEDGGVTIEMGGREWSASDEEIERHLVSCEQVGSAVEARWRWRSGDELADFIYRLSISGKSLLVEIEGGNGKATGIDLGYTAGAIHPRLINVPYLSLGDRAPSTLCTSGVFISSYIDWFSSSASSLSGAPADDEHKELRINGGCRYIPASDGRRVPLRERWVLTVSRDFEETLPTLPVPVQQRNWERLQELVWYDIPRLDSSEEAYVESYERLRTFKQRGLDHLLVNHPADTWHGHDSGGGLSLASDANKGGDDALIEYLEAVRELGYEYGLFTSVRDIAPTDPQWTPDAIAKDSDGSYRVTGPGRYLLKPTQMAVLGAAHASALLSKYDSAIELAHHAATPPWDRLDYDSRLADTPSFVSTLVAEQAAASAIAEAAGDSIVGRGGCHWLHRGLLPGYVARMSGPPQGRQPLLVDFDLKYLHPFERDAGLGTTSEYFGDELGDDDRHSRSPFFDRYLAATVAFGHAGLLLDVDEWGLEAVIKYYCMIQQLQGSYLGVPVESILYHNGGQLLETSEALVSGAYEYSQLQIVYANGLVLHVNGSWTSDWDIEVGSGSCRLPPGSFHSSGIEGDSEIYSADLGNGRMDYARCDDYLYCDTRGQTLETEGLTVNGAVLVRQEQWIIDVYPIDCQMPIEIEPGKLWPERRMPKLRILGFHDDDDEPQVISANVSESSVALEPSESIYKFRITLPEWMVEPGQ